MIRLFVRPSALAFVATAACSAAAPRAPYAPQPASALTEVSAPPPPGRVEMAPRKPRRGAVWIDGEWTWRRERWAWVPGRWVTPPPQARLAPWVFVRGPDGRLWYSPGTWRDAGGVALPPPPPLATAHVESTEVVDANGLVETTGPTLAPGATRSPDRGSSPDGGSS